MKQNYKHVPLSTDASIRVLELLPGTPGDPLAANLWEINLDDGPEFNALSYCWGEPIFNKLLQCNGQAFCITESVFDALQNLRNSKQPLCIWIDQICINQQDVSERNHQVQLMTRIYSNASIVIVWVGLGTESSEFMFQCIHDSDVPSGEGNRLVDARTEFLERPWFERVWTFQELVLAKNDPLLCCGSTRLMWSEFRQFEETLRYLISDNDSVAGLWTGFTYDFGFGNELEKEKYKAYQQSGGVERSIAAFRRQLTACQRFCGISFAREQGPMRPFAYQMHATYMKKSTDDRDKIYAILGISAFEGNPIIIDYENTVAGVFTEAMAKLIDQSIFQAFIFYYLRSGRPTQRRDIPGLPTWVVDFTALSHVPLGENRHAGVHRRFDIWKHSCIIRDAIEIALRSSAPVAKPSFRTLSLHVNGVNIGVVDDSFPAVAREDANLFDWMEQMVLLMGGRHLSPAEILLSADSAHCGGFENWDEMLSTFERLFASIDDPDLVQFEKNSRKFLELKPGMVIWPNFFVTDTGRIGRCNSPVQKGDIIAGLFGIDIPFVLSKDPDNDTYRMVDWAHVAAHCYRHVTVENSDGNANVIDISAYPRKEFVIV